MPVREATGYVAHALLGVYFLWVLSSTAPQLRRSRRDRGLRIRILLVKTAAVVVAALLVGVIHFWATAWWQVIVAVGLAAVIGDAPAARVPDPGRGTPAPGHAGPAGPQGRAPPPDPAAMPAGARVLRARSAATVRSTSG